MGTLYKRDASLCETELGVSFKESGVWLDARAHVICIFHFFGNTHCASRRS